MTHPPNKQSAHLDVALFECDKLWEPQRWVIYWLVENHHGKRMSVAMEQKYSCANRRGVESLSLEKAEQNTRDPAPTGTTPVRCGPRLPPTGERSTCAAYVSAGPPRGA
jgi:hypothetical protein